MKQLFNPHLSPGARDTGLLILRVAVALLMLTHGVPKLDKLMADEPVKFASVFGMTPEVSLLLAMGAELIFSIFVLFGFATRLSTIPIIITMAVVVFVVHGTDPLVKKELPLMYLIGFLTILILGPGKHSIDYVLHRRRSQRIQP